MYLAVVVLKIPGDCALTAVGFRAIMVPRSGVVLGFMRPSLGFGNEELARMDGPKTREFKCDGQVDE